MAETKRISSWAELTASLDDYREQGWLFRGEADESFGALKPKVGRVSSKSGSPRKKPYTLQDEQRAFEEFRKLAGPYLSVAPRSEIEWLAVAQHHGLPTRLLDWTANLLVAAFFAVELAGKARGVIYCVRGLEEIVDDGKSEAGSMFDPAADSVKLYRPAAVSPRVFPQQSVFTVHSQPANEFTHPRLQRWLVEPSACWPIKRSLNAAGVNLAALFPDLDGLCRHLGWLYKWSYFDSLADPGRDQQDAV
jgi:hypothetical protein